MAVLWDGQSGCGVSDQAFVFETYSKNCSGLQSVVDWPQCWGEGSWFFKEKFLKKLTVNLNICVQRKTRWM